MTPTREERREASRVRTRRAAGGSQLKTLKDVTGPGSWRDVLLALADLIDPEGDEDDSE